MTYRINSFDGCGELKSQGKKQRWIQMSLLLRTYKSMGVLMPYVLYFLWQIRGSLLALSTLSHPTISNYFLIVSFILIFQGLFPPGNCTFPQLRKSTKFLNCLLPHIKQHLFCEPSLTPPDKIGLSSFVPSLIHILSSLVSLMKMWPTCSLYISTTRWRAFFVFLLCKSIVDIYYCQVYNIVYFTFI